MNLLFVLTSSLFFLWIVREIFFWSKVWQDNEYRLDRFWEYLRRKKLKIFFSNPLFLFFKLLLFVSFVFVLINDDLLLDYQYCILFLYFIQAGIVIREIYRNALKKPRLVGRVKVIILLSILTVFLLFSVPLLDKFFWFLLIDLTLSGVIAFFVFLLSFPNELYIDMQIEKATKKLRSHKNLLVIGITGSYGKSVTKEFIAHVLATKFRVVKTHGHDNTASGIARVINEKVSDRTQIFVAEMSAYKKGEIALLCEFIRPKYGVLTAINNHHLSLFKTFENIKKTNYELLQSLSKNGTCIINGDNSYSYELSKKTKKKHVIYCSKKRVAIKGEHHITAYNSVQKKGRTTFDVQVGDTTMHLVKSSHHGVDYLLPGIYLAHSLGVPEKDIKKAVGSFR